MVEKYAVDGEHAIGLSIVFCNPETVLFGYAIRAARIKWGGLFLWYLLYFAEKFGSGGLIDTAFFFESQDADGFQQPQRPDSIRLSRVFRNIERYLDVRLCCQVVDFVRLYGLYDAYQRT